MAELNGDGGKALCVKSKDNQKKEKSFVVDVKTNSQKKTKSDKVSLQDAFIKYKKKKQVGLN